MKTVVTILLVLWTVALLAAGPPGAGAAEVTGEACSINCVTGSCSAAGAPPCTCRCRGLFGLGGPICCCAGTQLDSPVAG